MIKDIHVNNLVTHSYGQQLEQWSNEWHYSPWAECRQQDGYFATRNENIGYICPYSM